MEFDYGFFEEYVKSYCSRNKITLSELSVMSGIDRSTFYRIFRKDSKMTIGTFVSVCNATEANPNAFFKKDL